jgi:hypothetical protein
MTIRIEVLWHLENLRVTAQHMLQHRSNVTGRPPLKDLNDACSFLVDRLRAQLKDEPLEEVSFDTVNLYAGYWAHLVIMTNAQQQGDRLAGEVGGVKFIVGGTGTPGDHSDTFTLERQSEASGTIVADVTFLVDLAR